MPKKKEFSPPSYEKLEIAFNDLEMLLAERSHWYYDQSSKTKREEEGLVLSYLHERYQLAFKLLGVCREVVDLK